MRSPAERHSRQTTTGELLGIPSALPGFWISWSALVSSLESGIAAWIAEEVPAQWRYRLCGFKTLRKQVIVPPEKHAIVSGGLLRLLADTAVLLFKIRHLMWRFGNGLQDNLQAVLRNDHHALDKALDEIARHILALGRDIPPSYASLVQSSSIEQELEERSQLEMIRQIAADHSQIIADIDTLEVALPLGEDEDALRLLGHLRACHQDCRTRLAVLLPAGGERHH